MCVVLMNKYMKWKKWNLEDLRYLRMLDKTLVCLKAIIHQSSLAISIKSFEDWNSDVKMVQTHTFPHIWRLKQWKCAIIRENLISNHLFPWGRFIGGSWRVWQHNYMHLFLPHNYRAAKQYRVSFCNRFVLWNLNGNKQGFHHEVGCLTTLKPWSMNLVWWR